MNFFEFCNQHIILFRIGFGFSLFCVFVLLFFLGLLITTGQISEDKNGKRTYKLSLLDKKSKETFIKETIKQDERPARLLRIFEAYNLCDADAKGRLVREEMLVALGRQSDVDWEIVGDDSLKERRRRVHSIRTYQDAWY